MCVIKPTTFGAGSICAVCSPDCECVVCLPANKQESEREEFDTRFRALIDRSLRGPMHFSNSDREELRILKAQRDSL